MRIRLLSFLLLMGLAGCPAPEPEPEPGPGVQGWDVEDGPRAEEPKPTAPAPGPSPAAVAPAPSPSDTGPLKAPALKGAGARRTFMGLPIWVYPVKGLEKIPFTPPSDEHLDAAVARGWIESYRRGALPTGPNGDYVWLELSLGKGASAIWAWRADDLTSYAFFLQVPCAGPWEDALGDLGITLRYRSSWKVDGALSLAAIEGGPAADFPVFDASHELACVGFRPGTPPKLCLTWSAGRLRGKGYCAALLVNAKGRHARLLPAEDKERVKPLLAHAQQVGIGPEAALQGGKPALASANPDALPGPAQRPLLPPDLSGIVASNRFMGQPVSAYLGATRYEFFAPKDEHLKPAVERGWLTSFERGEVSDSSRYLSLVLPQGERATWVWKRRDPFSYCFSLVVPVEGGPAGWDDTLRRYGLASASAGPWQLKGRFSTFVDARSGVKKPYAFPLFLRPKDECYVFAGALEDPRGKLCLALVWAPGIVEDRYQKADDIDLSFGPAAAPARGSWNPSPRPPAQPKPQPKPQPQPTRPVSPTSPQGWPFPIYGVDDRGQQIPQRKYGRWRQVKASSSGAAPRPASRPTSPGPLGGSGTALAFVPERGGCVLVGGYRGGKQEQHTWLFDGAGWEQLPGGPTRISHLALAYDSRRKVLVAFGGVTAHSQLLDKTWELSAEGWREVPLGLRPPKRALHHMAYDESRGVVVLYGGKGADERGQLSERELSDTWEYEGKAWKQVKADPPRNNLAAVMVYDRQRQALAIQGGAFPMLKGLPFASTFDGRDWKQVADVDNSAGFASHGAVYDSDARRVVFVLPDKGELKVASLAPVLGLHHMVFGSRGGCPERKAFSCAYDPLRKQIVLFGGIRGEEKVDETWVLGSDGQEDFDAEQSERAPGWTRVAGALVEGREVLGRAFAADPRSGEALIFGGAVERGGGAGLEVLDETWTWKGQAWQRERPQTTPGPRLGALLFRRAEDWVLVGGRPASGEDLGDVWSWKQGSWTRLGETRGQRGVTPARERYAFDPRREELLLVDLGGTRARRLDCKTWRWEGIPGLVAPGKGYFEGGLFYQPGAKRIVALGRLRQGLARSWRAWTWSGTAWQPDQRVPAFDGSVHTPVLDAKNRTLWTLSDGLVHGLGRGDWRSFRAPSTAKGELLLSHQLAWADPSKGLLYVLGAGTRRTTDGLVGRRALREEETWAFDLRAGRRLSDAELARVCAQREAGFKQRYERQIPALQKQIYGETPAHQPPEDKPPAQAPGTTGAIVLEGGQQATWTPKGLLVLGKGYVELRTLSGKARLWRREFPGLQGERYGLSARPVVNARNTAAFVNLAPQKGSQPAPRGYLLSLLDGSTQLETPAGRFPRLSWEGGRLDLLVSQHKRWTWKAWETKGQREVTPLKGYAGLEREIYLFYSPDGWSVLVGGLKPRVVDLEQGKVVPLKIPNFAQALAKTRELDDAPGGFTRGLFLSKGRVALGGWLPGLPESTGWHLGWVLEPGEGRAVGRYPPLPERPSLGPEGRLLVGRESGVVFWHAASGTQLGHWQTWKRKEWGDWIVGAASLGPGGRLAVPLIKIGQEDKLLVYPPAALAEINTALATAEAVMGVIEDLGKDRDQAVEAALLKRPDLAKWKGPGGVTLLHHAAGRGREAVVKALLAAGAEIDALAEGRTPLIFATAYNRRATVELLLSKGAKVDAIDLSSRMDAFSIALMGNKAELARVLAGHRPSSLTLMAHGEWGTLNPQVRPRFEMLRERRPPGWEWLEAAIDKVRGR